MTRRARALGAAAAICSIPLFVPAPDARAANKSWIGGSGNWSVGSNWTPFGAPASFDNVFLTSTDLVPRTITYDNPGPFFFTYGNITVQTQQATTMELRQPGTSLEALSLSLSSFNDFATIRHTVTDGAAAFIGSLTLGAAGSLIVSNSSLYDVGSATQFNGAVTVDSTSTFTVGGTYVHSGGTFAGPMTVRATGALVLNGGAFGARVDNAGQLTVNGDVTIEGLTNRANFTLPAPRFLQADFIDQRGASFTQSDGARTMAASYTVQQGATWTQHGGLSEGNTTIVGGDFGPGTFVMNAGTHDVAGLLHVGLNSAGSFLQNGGTVRAILMTVGGAPTIGFGRGHYRLSGGSLVTSGQIIIGSENSLGGTFEQSGGSSDFFRFLVNVNSTTSGAIRLSGGLLRTNISSINNGSIDVTGGSMAVNGSLDGAGSVSVTGTGSLSAERIRQNSMFVGGSGRVFNTSISGRPATNRVGSLTFEEPGGGGGAIAGTWDLGINSLVIDYAGGPGASPAANVRRYLRSARGSGSWSGTGLTSSFSASTGFPIGFAEAGDILGPGGGTYRDLAVDDTAVLVNVTFYGDANLDSRVNLTDFNRLASNFGGTNKIWSQGDFNYDGNVNLQDFNLLAANFGMVAGPELTPGDWSALASVVPEPSITLALVGMIATRRSRRR